jgi:transcriptional regulator with XRE-family HTH domain
VLGIHRTYMGAVERGERNLTLQSLERMAIKIGVDAADLFMVRQDYRGRSPTCDLAGVIFSQLGSNTAEAAGTAVGI